MNAPHFDLPRTLTTLAQLGTWLRESCDTTLRLHADYDASQWIGPYLPIVNPPLWEIGHVAWFLERWCLRRLEGAGAPSLIANADRLYDSSRIAHVARWFLPLPDVPRTLDYLRRVTEAVLERIDTARTAPDEAYFIELSLYHQDMHNEAFRYTRQTLGYSDPFATGDGERVADDASGDVLIPAGTLMQGSTREDGWIFDNEKWAHEVHVQAFAIARRAVTNAEFAAFVDDGGYGNKTLWSEPGWHWREQGNRRYPRYWRRGVGWEQRLFDRWRPLAPDLPVIHVNAFEADAYCRWAGRRLPTEAEWERAAASGPGDTAKRRYPWGDDITIDGRANLAGAALVSASALPDGDSVWGCRQMTGNVWEWTSTVFEPYPGFAADPYDDYSRPWFGTHRVLRGGCFATMPRIARCAYRNFYTPDRADVFAGLRTCAIAAA